MRKEFTLFIAGLLLLLPLWGRAWYKSKAFYDRGMYQLQEGDNKNAIESFAESIRWRGPGIGKALESENQLRNIILKAPQEFKILALEKLRASLLASRGPGLSSPPSSPEMRSIEIELELLGARRENPVPKPDSYQLSYPKLFIIQSLFFAWVSFTIIFILKGFEKDGKLKAKSAYLWGGLMILSYLLWVGSL